MSDISPEAVERTALDMQDHMPFGRGANTLRAQAARIAELEAERATLQIRCAGLDHASRHLEGDRDLLQKELATARMSESIVAAAIQHEGVTISLPRPARHAQVLHCAEQFLPNWARPCQGFITSDGRFVNRVQARQIAWVAGQDPKTTGCERDLFSEDLW